MLSQIRIVKEKLNLAITQLCETSWMFAKDPDRDFTRERKLPLREVISILLCMEGGSLTGELLRYFRCSRYSPSSSAFIQQRQKINEFAFPSLFSLFVKHTDKDSLYKGYRLLAADGSDIQIPTDPKHTAGYFPGTNVQVPYSLLHLDAVYDLRQHTYLDAQVCGRRNSDERGTLCKTVDRSDITNALIIADRGYESYNLMAHIQEKGGKFLIRIKDIYSSGIASGLELPASDEFDLYCPIQLTRRRKTEIIPLLADKNHYKWLAAATPFVENITQEIYARLIMYNFSELITSHIVIQKFERKHPCKANFSVAVQVCRQFLLGNVSPPDVEATIGKNLSVIRSGRNNPRNAVVKHAVSFLYRVA